MRIQLLALIGQLDAASALPHGVGKGRVAAASGSPAESVHRTTAARPKLIVTACAPSSG